LSALLHGTPAAGVSETLRHVTRNGITELLQRAPLIFGWAAITLGIGPHSSFLFLFSAQKTRIVGRKLSLKCRDILLIVSRSSNEILASAAVVEAT